MKNTLLSITLALCAFTVTPQALQNTWWMVNGVSYFSYWHFGQDTIFFSLDNINYDSLSVYTTNSNLITISDINSSGCYSTDTGRYNFSIQSDTVWFNVISDACSIRLTFYTTYHFVRLYTGTEDINSISPTSIYPNPSQDGVYYISFYTSNNLPDKIYVLSADGRKIIDDISTTGKTDYAINLQPFASGIYFLVMENSKERKTVKLVR